MQLAQLLDLSLSELPNYLLALRLADEIAGTASDDGAHARTFREGEAVFARLVAASAPGMSRAAATRIARDALSAMVGSAVVGLDPEPEAAVRERVVAVLRAALVPDARRAAAVRRGDAASRTDGLIDSGRGGRRVDATARVTRPEESIMRPVSRVAMAAALTCPRSRCWPTTCTSCR